jgi:hypothetical protein
MSAPPGQASASFFEKKEAKKLPPWRRAGSSHSVQTDKSFLLLFFKKEALPSRPGSTPG